MRTNDGWDEGGAFDEALYLAWPDGAPAVELAFLSALPDEKKEQVLKRLRAVCLAEGGAKNLAAIARDAGIGRTALFMLRQRWTAKGTLASIMPYAGSGRGARKARPIDGQDEVEALAGTKPNSELVAELRGRSTASKSALQRRVRREAFRAAMEPDALLRDFGREFALDWSVLGIAVGESGSPQWAAGEFLIERSVGLICGFAIRAEGGDELPLYFSAYRGSQFAGRRRLRVLGVPTDTAGPRLDVVFGPAHDAIEGLRRPSVVDALEKAGAAVHTDGVRRFGRFLMDSVGASIGDVPLLPRTRTDASVPDAVLSARPAVSVADAALLVKRGVNHHNRPIEARLKELGLIDGTEDPSALISRLAPLSARVANLPHIVEERYSAPSTG